MPNTQHVFATERPTFRVAHAYDHKAFFLRSEKHTFTSYFIIFSSWQKCQIMLYENMKTQENFQILLTCFYCGLSSNYFLTKTYSAIFFGCVSRTLLASFALFFCGDLIQWSYNSFYTFGNFSFDWDTGTEQHNKLVLWLKTQQSLS